MTCKPKIVTRVIVAPTRKIKCCNCECEVDPGECHCGAQNWWAFDEFDGWYASGRIVVTTTVQQPTNPTTEVQK